VGLQQLGAAAVPALERTVAEHAADRQRARALWQLALITEHPKKYVAIALRHSNPDLRITGVRMARQHGLDMLDIIEQLKNDNSPQVRRELLIALRHNRDPRAVDLWVDLALLHDGVDRWYLEALGIAADKQWERFFDAWLARVGDQWDTPAGHDIIWRSRAPKACEYLVRLIKNASTEEEQYRYFRAFDFHADAAKLDALQGLLSRR
ncbi:MAG: dehydrogenase, partial [Planctomycetales bacterium]|nr:dehydrogenase [Planctomycetales bacterium]